MTDFNSYLTAAKTMYLSKNMAKRYPTPVDLALILQVAEQLKISWMEADSGLYFTDSGNIGIKGDLAMSLIMRSGQVKSWVEREDDKLTCNANGEWEGSYSITITSERNGIGSLSSTYTDEMAKRAGLWITKETNPTIASFGSYWYKNPQRQCKYKAKGMLIRDLYPDLINNLPILEEHEKVEKGKVDRTLNTKLL